MGLGHARASPVFATGERGCRGPWRRTGSAHGGDGGGGRVKEEEEPPPPPLLEGRRADVSTFVLSSPPKTTTTTNERRRRRRKRRVGHDGRPCGHVLSWPPAILVLSPSPCDAADGRAHGRRLSFFCFSSRFPFVPALFGGFVSHVSCGDHFGVPRRPTSPIPSGAMAARWSGCAAVTPLPRWEEDGPRFLGKRGQGSSLGGGGGGFLFFSFFGWCGCCFFPFLGGTSGVRGDRVAGRVHGPRRRRTGVSGPPVVWRTTPHCAWTYTPKERRRRW